MVAPAAFRPGQRLAAGCGAGAGGRNAAGLAGRGRGVRRRPRDVSMNILINYATPSFAAVRKLNSATGIRIGGFDKVIEYSPADLDSGFKRRNAHILGQARGAGYWLWKPYIIHQTLAASAANDLLCYSDAGSLFTRSVAPLVAAMQRTQQDVIAFEMKYHRERVWTKRDAFVLLDCDEDRYAVTGQVMAGCSFWRKTPFTTMLAAEWLRYVQDERIVTDAPNRCGRPNFPEFREHRHDQSVWSLLCKKHQVALHREPWRPAAADDGYTHSTYPDFITLKALNPRRLARWMLTHPFEGRLHGPILWTIAGIVRERWMRSSFRGGPLWTRRTKVR